MSFQDFHTKKESERAQDPLVFYKFIIKINARIRKVNTCHKIIYTFSQLFWRSLNSNMLAFIISLRETESTITLRSLSFSFSITWNGSLIKHGESNSFQIHTHIHISGSVHKVIRSRNTLTKAGACITAVRIIYLTDAPLSRKPQELK